MKIATFVNEHQEVVSCYEKGSVCLFENTSGSWKNNKDVPLEMNINMGLSELRCALKSMASKISDCEIFLLRESRGLLHVFLAELGFRTWRSEGTLIEQLDNVALKDAEIINTRAQLRASNSECKISFSCGTGCRSSFRSVSEAQIQKSATVDRTIPRPSCLGDIGKGHYQINLLKILNSEPDLNSKQILIPFLQETAFQKLEIFCDHLPKWLSREAVQLNLRIEYEATAASIPGMKVVIYPENNAYGEPDRSNR